jgi:ubiquinone/menaquinone biosynthesis C-methylase UbiE
MKNVFGLELLQIKEVVTDKSVKETIGSLILPVLTYLGIPEDKAREIISDCLQAAADYSQLEAYEEQAHKILEKQGVTQRIPQKLTARAAIVYSQIEPYLLAGTVLDYGCGDGQVAELIAKNKHQQVSLADVYEHPNVKETALKFVSFKQGAKTPFSNGEFDNTLALTVFHHCSDPIESIKDVYRVTRKGGRVLVIESVYGVDGKELPLSMQKKTKNYLRLSAEQQRKVNIFFDHFYNRVLNYSKDSKTKVNVPFNFNTPANWEKVFADYNLKQEKLIHLGLDQPTVPEYHTLHILRKI